MKLNSSLAITKTKNCTKAPRAGNIGTMKHTVKKICMLRNLPSQSSSMTLHQTYFSLRYFNAALYSAG